MTAMEAKPGARPAAPLPSARPPFRADQVGSLLRPAELKEAHGKALKGELPMADLREIEDRCIRDVVRLQESLGLHAVTDGEFRRTLFHADFLGQLEDGEGRRTVKFEFRKPDAGTDANVFLPPAVRISGKVKRTRPIEVEGFKYLRSLTQRTAKLAIPSPTMLLRGGRQAVDAAAYPDLDGFYEDIAAAYRAEIRDLAAAGCRYLQLDDTNFAYLCDPRIVAAMRAHGEEVETLPRRFAAVINAALAERPADMTVCIHVCRGNDRGRHAAEGGYEPVADLLFNHVDVDGYFLEYDHEGAGDFQPLRHLPRHKRVVLGLISSKVPELAPRDALLRRIDEAAAVVPIDNLCLSPQCGFASGFRGNPLSEADEQRKLAQVVALAEEVWGTAC